MFLNHPSPPTPTAFCWLPLGQMFFSIHSRAWVETRIWGVKCMAFSVTQYKTAGYRCHLVTTCFVPLEIPAIDWLVSIGNPAFDRLVQFKISAFDWLVQLKSLQLTGLFHWKSRASDSLVLSLFPIQGREGTCLLCVALKVVLRPKKIILFFLWISKLR